MKPHFFDMTPIFRHLLSATALTVALQAAAGPPRHHADDCPPLDEHHILLDGALSDTEAAALPFVFNDLHEAMSHLQDSTTVYIRPWVYWVDNPDKPDVVRSSDGRGPFGMVVRTSQLALIGLGQCPEDVVLASQRGQMQGAVGNFTMLDMHVDRLTVENMTLGNYCNVDLVYPLRPELGRKRRADAITQAHVGYVHGQSLTARKVRFISRLNLNPLNGAKESLYDSCHFECTDDALNGGRALYRHCDFDLYGAKPLWSTFGDGPVFEDCDFYVRTTNRETFFCKQGGPVTLVNCRYHAPEGSYVGWTPYPQPFLRCYQQGFTLNGKPYVVGSRSPLNTIVLSAYAGTMPPHLALNRREATLQAGTDTLHLTADEDVTWAVEKGFEHSVKLCDAGPTAVTVVPTADIDDYTELCVTARTADGREAACMLRLKPTLLPQPAFVRKPKIKIKDGVARLDYSLDLGKYADETQISWFRNGTDGKGTLLAEGHEQPLRTYRLRPGDAGHTLTAVITPRHRRSVAGGNATAVSSRVRKKDVAHASELHTDFSDMPLLWQQARQPDTWTVDGHKPADTEAFDWTFNPEKPMWEYGEGFNGAVGRGLLQAQRGARLMYTPAVGQYAGMSLTLNVDPTKTAGQGFGSATGQYMDVCLKFDTETLTGYGLRIVRTVKHAKAVDFYLVQYDNGVVTPLTEPLSATCYRTGCTISLDCTGDRLRAHVETATPKPDDSTLPHTVDLQATVKPLTFGGVHIQHTGSCGESTTMLHRLRVKWQ